MHPGRRSPSPPAQPISKRDKKRNQHIAHQQELINDFTQNRDVHYRAQLVALQYDMNLITAADPYDPEPLEDSPEEIARMVEEVAAGTAYQSEMSKLAGRWYSEFVQEVNEAKEAKEVELTQLMVGRGTWSNCTKPKALHDYGPQSTQKLTVPCLERPSSQACQTEVRMRL